MLYSPELPLTSSSLESILQAFFETFPDLSAEWAMSLPMLLMPFLCYTLNLTDLFPLLHFDFKGWDYKLLISLILVFRFAPDS